MAARRSDPKVRTPAGDAFSWLAFQILKLGGVLSSAGDELARPAGQTSARWQVLAAVEETPRPVAHVARALALARQSVQRVADVLVEEGLTAYEDNPEHQRAKLLRLTPRGRAALATIQTHQRAWADAIGAELSEAELRRASALLERVFAAVAKRDAPGA
ncbi:MAG TPA: MarR family winged helix-turn-helix transcriptional regulator [Polyangia bacterium]|jgi:DNA-binding MarR family transcriptional regulator|nr:MarR family winged helix-turn-helix transcriptional regulator [Polyangia bacterium]